MRSQARLTMPYEHGRTDNIFEKSADRRIRSTFRRSVDQDNYKFCSKEFGFRSSEQSDEMDDFEPVSSPQIFAPDEFGCNTTAYLDLSSTIKDAETVPFSSDGSTREIPNIALKSIWQWYEEPGCFGLEVRAHDYCNSGRQHNGRSEFTAYFVPYLSAVQLFGKSRSARYCNRSGEAATTCEADKREKSLGSLPNLSMLLPQPHKGTNFCLSESYSSAAEEIFDKSIHMDHAELIFEYFESDQPPWRRPLYEKIKELVSGDRLPASCIFGDPLKLESVKLHDLHPASWYCVAWYPIYRLQTYRDKGENWFQPRDMDMKVFHSEDAHFSNASDLLKERLRTLKQTASVMARAVVHKRDQRSANRHPDYEFFVSRSW
ncbi:hypothetical protein MUK42_31046 [Musa troglodytarum]|uniref:Uncharacterized protein n=1 Tax=Musa troglodytarum TaxID=320322 RepID=A0A9E7GZA3_9LILI|nr:hypothetical protein MUK42_31046 [Musa troglodytarum]